MPRIASRVSQLNGEGALAVFSRAKELEREGRSIIYAAKFEQMNALVAFLTENCCGGVPCTPTAACKPARKRIKVPA